MKSPQSRVTPIHRKPVIKEPLIVDNWPAQSDQLDSLISTLTETNLHLSTLADAAVATQSFFKKWLPWGIAAASVAWPVIGQIVAKASTVVVGLPTNH